MSSSLLVESSRSHSSSFPPVGSAPKEEEEQQQQEQEDKPEMDVGNAVWNNNDGSNSPSMKSLNSRMEDDDSFCLIDNLINNNCVKEISFEKMKRKRMTNNPCSNNDSANQIAEKQLLEPPQTPITSNSRHGQQHHHQQQLLLQGISGSNNKNSMSYYLDAFNDDPMEDCHESFATFGTDDRTITTEISKITLPPEIDYSRKLNPFNKMRSNSWIDPCPRQPPRELRQTDSDEMMQTTQTQLKQKEEPQYTRDVEHEAHDEKDTNVDDGSDYKGNNGCNNDDDDVTRDENKRTSRKNRLCKLNMTSMGSASESCPSVPTDSNPKIRQTKKDEKQLLTKSDSEEDEINGCDGDSYSIGLPMGSSNTPTTRTPTSIQSNTTSESEALLNFEANNNSYFGSFSVLTEETPMGNSTITTAFSARDIPQVSVAVDAPLFEVAEDAAIAPAGMMGNSPQPRLMTLSDGLDLVDIIQNDEYMDLPTKLKLVSTYNKTSAKGDEGKKSGPSMSKDVYGFKETRRAAQEPHGDSYSQQSLRTQEKQDRLDVIHQARNHAQNDRRSMLTIADAAVPREEGGKNTNLSMSGPEKHMKGSDIMKGGRGNVAMMRADSSSRWDSSPDVNESAIMTSKMATNDDAVIAVSESNGKGIKIKDQDLKQVEVPSETDVLKPVIATKGDHTENDYDDDMSKITFDSQQVRPRLDAVIDEQSKIHADDDNRFSTVVSKESDPTIQTDDGRQEKAEHVTGHKSITKELTMTKKLTRPKGGDPLNEPNGSRDKSDAAGLGLGEILNALSRRKHKFREKQKVRDGTDDDENSQPSRASQKSGASSMASTLVKLRMKVIKQAKAHAADDRLAVTDQKREATVPATAPDTKLKKRDAGGGRSRWKSFTGSMKFNKGGSRASSGRKSERQNDREYPKQAVEPKGSGLVVRPALSTGQVQSNEISPRQLDPQSSQQIRQAIDTCLLGRGMDGSYNSTLDSIADNSKRSNDESQPQQQKEKGMSGTTTIAKGRNVNRVASCESFADGSCIDEDRSKFSSAGQSRMSADIVDKAIIKLKERNSHEKRVFVNDNLSPTSKRRIKNGGKNPDQSISEVGFHSPTGSVLSDNSRKMKSPSTKITGESLSSGHTKKRSNLTTSAHSKTSLSDCASFHSQGSVLDTSDYASLERDVKDETDSTKICEQMLPSTQSSGRDGEDRKDRGTTVVLFDCLSPTSSGVLLDNEKLRDLRSIDKAKACECDDLNAVSMHVSYHSMPSLADFSCRSTCSTDHSDFMDSPSPVLLSPDVNIDCKIPISSCSTAASEHNGIMPSDGDKSDVECSFVDRFAYPALESPTSQVCEPSNQLSKNQEHIVGNASTETGHMASEAEPPSDHSTSVRKPTKKKVKSENKKASGAAKRRSSTKSSKKSKAAPSDTSKPREERDSMGEGLKSQRKKNRKKKSTSTTAATTNTARSTTSDLDTKTTKLKKQKSKETKKSNMMDGSDQKNKCSDKLSTETVKRKSKTAKRTSSSSRLGGESDSKRSSQSSLKASPSSSKKRRSKSSKKPDAAKQ